METILIDKIFNFQQSQATKDIGTILAYLVKHSGTFTDDEIVNHADEIAASLSEFLHDINESNPTPEQLKDAIIRLLEILVSLTKTKWDDRALAIIKLLT